MSLRTKLSFPSAIQDIAHEAVLKILVRADLLMLLRTTLNSPAKVNP